MSILRWPTTLLVAMWSFVCFGQSDAHLRWTDSTITEVKPEMRQQYEGYLKQIMSAYKKAGISWFVTFQNFAGTATEYTTVVPIMKFADLDGPSVVERLMGEETWANLSSNIARCYTAQIHEYSMPQPALEINKVGVPMAFYWIETRTQVAQGKMDEYLKWLKNDYRPALEKAGVAQFRVSRAIFGADGSEIVSMRMLNSLAEIDRGPILAQALGEEGARAVNAKSVALVRASITNIVRMRTDLSHSAGLTAFWPALLQSPGQSPPAAELRSTGPH